MKGRPHAWSALGLAAAIAVAIGVPAAALAHRDTAPKIVGNPRAGKPVFQTTCGVCHMLKAAGSVGNIGPDLNKVTLSEAVIIKAITNGGATVMTKAQAARYTTQMTAYKNALTTARIQDIAAFVYTSTHAK
jgi:mono/diheme cytochrome c family protein